MILSTPERVDDKRSTIEAEYAMIQIRTGASITAHLLAVSENEQLPWLPRYYLHQYNQ